MLTVAAGDQSLEELNRLLEENFLGSSQSELCCGECSELRRGIRIFSWDENCPSDLAEEKLQQLEALSVS